MNLRLSGSPVPRPTVAPRTVVVSKLLAVSSIELERVIQEELSENPALELADAGYCERCGAVFSGLTCPRCDGAVRKTETAPRELDWSGPAVRAPASGEDWDPFSRVAAPRSIRDHLLWQLYPLLSPPELEVASLLLESLDHHGLLGCELDAVSSAAGMSLAQVCHVLGLIQRQDPVGIGATTVEESLLIQLESFENTDQVVQLSRCLIEDHWEALGKGKLESIATALDVDVAEIRRARDFIRTNLHPYPIYAHVEGAGSANQPVDAYYLRPDVIITAYGAPGEEEFDIQFPEEKRFRLDVHRAYRHVLDDTAFENANAKPEEYQHVREWVARSKLFISGWHDRWRTLRRVVDALVGYQREFLLNDVQKLRPLTRCELADMLGIHESTVSRAVASKYAQIPDGQIVALADFFDGSLKAKALIRGFVSEESRPLTDSELVELLAEAGISVARRTVAKYRQALGILPSGLR